MEVFGKRLTNDPQGQSAVTVRPMSDAAAPLSLKTNRVDSPVLQAGHAEVSNNTAFVVVSYATFFVGSMSRVYSFCYGAELNRSMMLFVSFQLMRQ